MAERGVFFLRNKGVDALRYQPTATEAEIQAESAFWRLTILAGSVVERDGRVHVPETLDADFLARLDGAPFLGFVDEVSSLGSVAPGRSVEPGQTDTDEKAGLVAIAAATLGLAVLMLLAISIVARRRKHDV